MTEAEVIRAAMELSPSERERVAEILLESVDVAAAPTAVTDEQKAVIRSRAAELEADPAIGLTRDELRARVAARRA